MYNAAVIGDRETVIGFKALGLTVCYAESEEQARDHLTSLAKQNTAVIYITEPLAELLKEDLADYAKRTLPAVIMIPGKDGSTGRALANIGKAVEKAVGADILK